MNISGTLASIKEYFLHWHKNEYDDIHHKTNTITNEGNDANYPPTSAAVYNYICGENGINNKINNAKNELDTLSNTLASVNAVDWRTYSNRAESTAIVEGNVHNGLMKWEDRVLIDGLKEWKYFDHTFENSGLSESWRMRLWINQSTHLAYLSFWRQNFEYLNGRTYGGIGHTYSASNNAATGIVTYTFNKENTSSSNSLSLIHRIAPETGIYTHTHNPYIIVGIDNGGNFIVKSTKTFSSVEVHGSLLWFYGNSEQKQVNIMNV